MLRHIKLSHNQRIAAVCSFSTLAVAGLIGGIYSLGAFADGNRTVNLPDTTVSNRDITWTFGDNSSLTLSAGTGMPDINTPAQGENNVYYQDGQVLISLWHYGDNICNDYSLNLSSQGWEGQAVQCIAGDGSQEFHAVVDESNVPNNLVLIASKSGSNANPSAPLIVSIAANNFGNDNKTASFSLGSESRAITFTNSWNTENNPHFEFENTGDQAALKTALASGLSFHAEGDCMDGEQDNYVVKFGSQGGWNKTFTCNNGNYSLQFNNDESIPPEGLNIWITNTNQQGPAQEYDIEFGNPAPTNDDTYMIVSSSDQSLAGKTFRITPSSGHIGCAGDQNGTHCSQHFTSNPFDPIETNDFFYTISGENFTLTTEEDQNINDVINIYFRGPDGFAKKVPITKVGNSFQISLKTANIPAEIHQVTLYVDEPHEENGNNGGPEERVHPGDWIQNPVTVTVTNNEGTENIPKSFYFSRIEINWTPIELSPSNADCENSNQDRADNTKCPSTFTDDNFKYRMEDGDTTVDIDFGTLFIRKFIHKIIVNDIPYDIPIDYTNRQSWLSHYAGQMTGFRLTVPYSSTGYNIKVDADELEGHYQQIGNFLWSNSEEDKFRPDGSLNDEYIGHSNLEVLTVVCHISDNDTPDNPDDDIYESFSVENGEDAPAGCVFEYQPDDDQHPVGSLVVPEGSTVTVRLKPQYGWQVTSFRLSGDDEIATDPGAVAQYTIGIRRGNAHIGANVTEVDDEVNAISDKIKSGSISLGGEEIDEGTAMLSVNDADLTDAQKDEFQKQAGNYSVSTFLDIDLDQVFYDGKGGYWQGEEMSELAHEATITLTLEEGVDGNSVILVHKKHDGTYEIIPTTYDARTNTITFKTSSFSDYAIASATVANSNTFDSIVRYFILFAASSAAAVFFATRKVQETSK